jgi:hypothetical protein
MNFITGHHKASAEICEALGLKTDRVKKIDLHIAANSIATVEVEMYLEVENGEKLIPILKKFRLVEKNEDSELKLNQTITIITPEYDVVTEGYDPSKIEKK